MLDQGMSRRSLAEATGIPEPTIERFETKGKISLESFLKLVVEFGWLDESIKTSLFCYDFWVRAYFGHYYGENRF